MCLIRFQFNPQREQTNVHFVPLVSPNAMLLKMLFLRRGSRGEKDTISLDSHDHEKQRLSPFYKRGKELNKVWETS